jgi:hypothetical protein
VAHGKKDAAFIRRKTAEAWVGLSSFALHRQNMRQACTLKVREYLRLGLPVYAGYQDVFQDTFPYFRQGECNMADLLHYAREVRTSSPVAVAAAARPYIDKKVLLGSLYESLRRQALS